MGYRGVISAVLACVVIGGGVVVAESVHTGSASHSPASQAAEQLPPVVAPPTVIPQGIPQTLSLETTHGTLINQTAVDQELLKVGANGAVTPGDKPGLYVANGVSTLPGTDQGTTIVAGHAKASNAMVFNPLMQLGQGDIGNATVVLQMQQGQLTYTVQALYLVDKVDLPTKHALADNRPGRVELITCDVEGGRDTFQNLIVVACDASHSQCAA